MLYPNQHVFIRLYAIQKCNKHLSFFFVIAFIHLLNDTDTNTNLFTPRILYNVNSTVTLQDKIVLSLLKNSTCVLETSNCC